MGETVYKLTQIVTDSLQNPERGFLLTIIKEYTQNRFMSTLHHESLLESCYEDVMAEITDTGDIAMMNNEDIERAVQMRFESMCQ